MQKFDSCSGESYPGGAQTHPGAAEQTVIAQRQHHQQFLGQSLPLVKLRASVDTFLSIFSYLNEMTDGGADWLLPFPASDASRSLPDFIELELGPSNTENISPEDVKALQSLYREHCEVRGREIHLNTPAGRVFSLRQRRHGGESDGNAQPGG